MADYAFAATADLLSIGVVASTFVKPKIHYASCDLAENGDGTVTGNIWFTQIEG